MFIFLVFTTVDCCGGYLNDSEKVTDTGAFGETLKQQAEYWVLRNTGGHHRTSKSKR